jgi:hypothetical protein
MTGQEYINLAKTLLQNNKEEEIRCGISRYYYGLLHFAIDKLIEIEPSEYSNLKDNLNNLPYAGYSIHGSTIRDVQSINSATGGSLDIARELRVFSDYNFKESIFSSIETKIGTFNNKEEISSFLEKVFDDIKKLKKKSSSRNATLSADFKGLSEIRKRLG